MSHEYTQEQIEKKRANSDLNTPIQKADYSVELAHLKSEVHEAYLQVNQAIEVANEKQLAQLNDYKNVLAQIDQQVNG